MRIFAQNPETGQVGIVHVLRVNKGAKTAVIAAAGLTAIVPTNWLVWTYVSDAPMISSTSKSLIATPSPQTSP